jgi:hypothetical protein
MVRQGGKTVALWPGLEVKVSTVKSAGNGLFVASNGPAIEPGQRIRMGGRLLSFREGSKEHQQRIATKQSTHVVADKSGALFDGKPLNGETIACDGWAIGHLINSPRKKHEANCRLRWGKRLPTNPLGGMEAVVEAKRRIHPGEELFMPYGRSVK